MLLKTNRCGGMAAGGHDILSPKKLKNKEQFLIPQGQKMNFFPRHLSWFAAFLIRLSCNKVGIFF